MPILDAVQVLEAAGLESWQVPDRPSHVMACRETVALDAVFARANELSLEAELRRKAAQGGLHGERWWLRDSIRRADTSGDVEGAELQDKRMHKAALRAPLVAPEDRYDPRAYLAHAHMVHAHMVGSLDHPQKSSPSTAPPGPIASDSEVATSLLNACKSGDNQLVERLLRRHDIHHILRHVEAGSEKTALHLAAQYGNAFICARLLDRGIDVHVADKHGRSPLALACMHAKPMVVKTLLHANARPWHWDRMERNALHLACCSSDLDCVQLLLNHSQNLVNAPDGAGRTSLWYSLSSVHRSTREVLMHLLIKQRADVNIPDSHGRTPLWYASKTGSASLVSLLLDFQADPNLRDRDGLSPFDVARGLAGTAYSNAPCDTSPMHEHKHGDGPNAAEGGERAHALMARLKDMNLPPAKNVPLFSPREDMSPSEKSAQHGDICEIPAFQAAQVYAEQLKASNLVSMEEMTTMYKWFKQATEGDFNMPTIPAYDPETYNPEDAEAFYYLWAWVSVKGTSQEDAQLNFIDTVSHLIGKYSDDL